MHDQGNGRTNVLRQSGPKCDGLALTRGEGLLAERMKGNAGWLDLARSRPELEMACSPTGRGPRVEGPCSLSVNGCPTRHRPGSGTAVALPPAVLAIPGGAVCRGEGCLPPTPGGKDVHGRAADRPHADAMTDSPGRDPAEAPHACGPCHICYLSAIEVLSRSTSESRRTDRSST